MSLDQQLGTALTREIDSLQQLLDILRQEHDALLAADIEAIEQTTATKNLALAAQVEATAARQNITRATPFGKGEEGLQQLIASCENRAELIESLTRLNALAELCHETNRSNWRLISQKQEQVRGALNIIRQTDSSAPTYSGQGTATTDQGTRSLGKA